MKNGLLFLSTFLLCSAIEAQLCQGSLGDPIINITFGAGAARGAPLPTNKISYTYYAGDCVSDGFYTIDRRTDLCHGDSWHTLSNDHTGDTNGYFLLANASYEPGLFYIDTVSGLCSNTTFELAVWVLNLLKPGVCGFSRINPDLTFSVETIDGAILNTYNTGEIPVTREASWKQYGFFFTTPVDLSQVVLKINNNAPGGCGNDLALDDITFRPCGPKISASFVSYAGDTVSFCNDQPQSFQLTNSVSTGYANPSYQWQESINGAPFKDIQGANQALFTKAFVPMAQPANYQYRVSLSELSNINVAQCRIVSDIKTIISNRPPNTGISGKASLCEGDNLAIAASADAASYEWQGPNGFTTTDLLVAIQNVSIQHSGEYRLLATGNTGCISKDSVQIIVNPGVKASTSFMDSSICKTKNIQLQASGGIQCRWSPSAGLSAANTFTPIASPDKTTTYKATVTNEFGCSDSTFVRIGIIEKPVANAGPDKIIQKGMNVQLEGAALGQNITYTWSPAINISDTHILNPIVSPRANTNYTLTVTSIEGCGMDADVVNVSLFSDIFVPTAFTPNADNKNDQWLVPGLTPYKKYSVRVYNRNGELVFRSVNTNRPWNGKLNGVDQPSGVFAYVIEVEDLHKFFKGTLVLIR